MKPTRRLRRAKRCTRSVRVKTISFTAKTGANAIRLPVGTLAPGSYSAVLSVADACREPGRPDHADVHGHPEAAPSLSRQPAVVPRFPAAIRAAISLDSAR